MNLLQSSDVKMRSIKENSILSFNTAARFPVDFIEFDVQREKASSQKTASPSFFCLSLPLKASLWFSHFLLPCGFSIFLSVLSVFTVSSSSQILLLIDLRTAIMSDEGEKKCPLCAEEMDLTDQLLKACKCGYEVISMATAEAFLPKRMIIKAGKKILRTIDLSKYGATNMVKLNKSKVPSSCDLSGGNFSTKRSSTQDGNKPGSQDLIEDQSKKRTYAFQHHGQTSQLQTRMEGLSSVFSRMPKLQG